MNGGYNMEDRVFKIYAGMGGSFGGAEYIGSYTFDSLEDAENFAYEEAREIYASYAGMHGIPSYGNCLEELRDDYIDDGALKEAAEYLYDENINDWIEYYAIEVPQ